MSCFDRFATLAVASAAAIISAQGAAYAGAFALREQSATGQGMSFAGVASGSGRASSMYWNPATITMNPGFVSEWHGAGVIPRTDITPTLTRPAGLQALGPSGDIGVDGFVPASYTTFQLNDRLWVGLYTGAPFGSDDEAEPDLGRPALRPHHVRALARGGADGRVQDQRLAVRRRRHPRDLFEGALLLGHRPDPCQSVAVRGERGSGR